MNENAGELVRQLKAFNGAVMDFVERCSEEDWKKMCEAEDWTVGVTARHIGAGHYNVLGLVKMIVAGEKLPELTSEDVIRSANDHAAAHAACTRAEVLEVLRTRGAELCDYVAVLDDAALERTSYLTLLKQDVSTRKFLETVVLWSGGEHFASMKKAVGL